MEQRFLRTEILVGKKGMDLLKNSHIMVFGVGGVGSFAAEALSRAGVGRFTLVDYDIVDITNCNRQIPALTSTVGQYKVSVMQARMLDINPSAIIQSMQVFCTNENADSLIESANPDFIVDAVDNVTAKIAIIRGSIQRGIPLISSMGAGNKIDPTKFLISDIEKTHTCPLARDVRKHLRKFGIEKGVNVVFSTEKPLPVQEILHTESGKVIPGSFSFVASSAGLLIASHVIRSLLET